MNQAADYDSNERHFGEDRFAEVHGAAHGEHTQREPGAVQHLDTDHRAEHLERGDGKETAAAASRKAIRKRSDDTSSVRLCSIN